LRTGLSAIPEKYLRNEWLGVTCEVCESNPRQGRPSIPSGKLRFSTPKFGGF
jgi:hypothetical protein